MLAPKRSTAKKLFKKKVHQTPVERITNIPIIRFLVSQVFLKFYVSQTWTLEKCRRSISVINRYISIYEYRSIQNAHDTVYCLTLSINTLYTMMISQIFPKFAIVFWARGRTRTNKNFSEIHTIQNNKYLDFILIKKNIANGIWIIEIILYTSYRFRMERYRLVDFQIVTTEANEKIVRTNVTCIAT